MKKTNNLEEGKTYYSKVTQIFYRVIKGELWKMPDYPNAVRAWSESGYTGVTSHFKLATKEQLKSIKRVKGLR